MTRRMEAYFSEQCVKVASLMRSLSNPWRDTYDGGSSEAVQYLQNIVELVLLYLVLELKLDK